MHVGIANSRWRGKHSRHSRRMHNPHFFYVSGKSPLLKHATLQSLTNIYIFFLMNCLLCKPFLKRRYYIPVSRSLDCVSGISRTFQKQIDIHICYTAFIQAMNNHCLNLMLMDMTLYIKQANRSIIKHHLQSAENFKLTFCNLFSETNIFVAWTPVYW